MICLQAEYNDYVTSSMFNELINDANYNSKVEFALKLGYTESQVQIAVMKLGPKLTQNELLAELIKLGSHSTVQSTVSLPIIQLPKQHQDDELRPIVIDGSNVAIS